MWRRQSSPTVAVAEKSVEIRTFSWTRLLTCLLVCNNRCLVSGFAVAVHRQDMDVPVIMRDSGSAPDSVHRGIGGHSSSQQRQVFDLPVAAMMGLFDAFCVIFRAPPGCPGVERQFFEPSTMKSSSSSRAPRGGGVAGSLTPR